MTEHQTRITTSNTKTLKHAALIKIEGKATVQSILRQWYTSEYVKAMAGGDRFHFTRATRRYLKALRELST